MERWGWALPKILFAGAAISIWALWSGPSQLQAQRVRKRRAVATAVVGESADENAGTGNFAAPDRNLLQALKRAQKVLKEHRYGEALEGLSQVLRSNEDYLYQPDRKVPIKGLKAEAQQLLGQMPREGLDLYEVRAGAEARNKLNRAVAGGRWHRTVGSLRTVVSYTGGIRSNLPAGLVSDGSRRAAGRGVDVEAAPRSAGRGRDVRAGVVAHPGRLLLPGRHARRLPGRSWST